MIGGLEILIVLLVIAVVVGYRYLPQFGRSAGKGLRSAGKEAKQLSAAAGEKFDEKVASAVDPAELGRSAGRGVREARELKQALTSLPDAEPAGEAGPAAAKPEPEAPRPESTAPPEAPKAGPEVRRPEPTTPPEAPQPPGPEPRP